MPELNNFLTILNREEAEYVDQIKAKYSLMQIHLSRRLQELRKQRAATAVDVTETYDDVTRRIDDSLTLHDRASSPDSTAPLAGATKGMKLKKSDVHKDTPRPGDLTGQGQVRHDQDQREQSPSCVTFSQDDREGVFV